MFGLLKKKISNFIGKLVEKEEEKPVEELVVPEEKVEPPKEEIPEKVEEPSEPTPEEPIKELEEEKPIEEIKEETVEEKKEEKIVFEKPKEEIKVPEFEIEEPKEEKKEVPEPEVEKPKIEEKEEIKEEPKIEEKVEEEKVPEPKIEEPIEQPKEEVKEEKPPEPQIEEIKEEPEEKRKVIELPPEKPKKKGIFDQLKSIVTGKEEEPMMERDIEEIIEEKPVIEEKVEEPSKEEIPEEKVEPIKEKIEIKEPPKKEIKVKQGVFDQLKSVVTGKVEIKKEDLSELLEEFELGMLEGDVALEVAGEIKETLEKRLIGRKIKRSELSEELQKEMESILIEVMKQENKIDIVEFVKTKEKPVKIMFLGINGAGKTTTLAKIAHMLQGNGLKVVFAAADTFRAAAIEQLEEHAKRVGVKVIKRPYGSDSTAVVYDAVNYAKAHGIDAVLIDTAGRQDTNVDLINELKKMERVIKPDLKVYIGESIGGNAVVSQVSSFNTEIGLNGVILTKIDCDPKGGTIISISRTTGLPILYITDGQNYEDIKEFDPKKIVYGLVS